MKRLFLLTLIFLSQFLIAQEKDSLLNIIKKGKNDTSLLQSVIQLSNIILDEKPDTVIILCNNAIEIAKKIQYKKGECRLYGMLGNALHQIGETDKAIEYHSKSLALGQELKNTKLIAASYNNIGLCYYEQGKLNESLDYYLKALKINEETGNKSWAANNLTNISQTILYMGNSEKAFEYEMKALKLREEIGDEFNLAASYHNIAGTIYKRGDKEKAIEYVKKAILINQKFKNFPWLSNNYAQLSDFHLKNKNYKEAIINLEKGLEVSRQSSDAVGICERLQGLGHIYKIQGKYNLAENYYLEALEISNRIGYLPQSADMYKALSYISYNTGKYKDANNYLIKYTEIHDSIFSSESRNSLNEMEAKYQAEKKDAEIKLLNKDKELAKNESDRQKIFTYAVVFGFVIVMIFSIIFFLRWKITKKQKQIIEIQKLEVEKQRSLSDSQRLIIESKQKEILDSIQYAKRIQQAMLTADQFFKEHLAAEHFILYLPKDIVSGDFYWATVKKNKFYLITGDCTGHGVPGAFMSLLNISCLNSNISDKGIEDPAEILNQQRLDIISALNPTGTENSRDGMDCVLLQFDFNTRILNFAAANNPLWIIRNGELIEFAPDKMPVGMYHDNLKSFNRNEIQLFKNDLIYTFTDGYVDQFGGTLAKKFNAKRLRELLLANINLPLKEQKTVLSNTINEWKGNLEQIDDILVIGIKIA